MQILDSSDSLDPMWVREEAVNFIYVFLQLPQEHILGLEFKRTVSTYVQQLHTFATSN